MKVPHLSRNDFFCWKVFFILISHLWQSWSLHCWEVPLCKWSHWGSKRWRLCSRHSGRQAPPTATLLCLPQTLWASRDSMHNPVRRLEKEKITFYLLKGIKVKLVLKCVFYILLLWSYISAFQKFCKKNNCILLNMILELSTIDWNQKPTEVRSLVCDNVGPLLWL